jgi:hypothetical protein
MNRKKPHSGLLPERVYFNSVLSIFFAVLLMTLMSDFPAMAGVVCTTVSLDKSSYSGNFQGTFAVVITGNSPCSIDVQDDTSGSWALIPATGDPELDCNGTSCNGTGTTFTKTLKCEGIGTFNIRVANGAVLSAASTVTCNPVTFIRNAVLNSAVIQ